MHACLSICRAVGFAYFRGPPNRLKSRSLQADSYFLPTRLALLLFTRVAAANDVFKPQAADKKPQLGVHRTSALSAPERAKGRNHERTNMTKACWTLRCMEKEGESLARNGSGGLR